MRSLAILLSAAFTSVVVAAPGPKGKDELLYYPVKEGAKRVMAISVSGTKLGQGRESVETVSKVEEKDGKYRVTMLQEWPGQAPKKNGHTSVLDVSSKGLIRVASGGRDLPEPVTLLKLPAKAGDTWMVADATSTVGKEEEIEVPAGKYKCIPVTSEYGPAGRPVKTVSWYAPAVGLVKSVTTSGDIETIYTLKSFSPGK
jgi:hypothetical protein